MDIHQTPDSFYVFIDQSNPLAVMNLDITGQFSSPVVSALQEPSFSTAYAASEADFLPFVPNSAKSIDLISPFAMNIISDYRVEYDAELARRAYFKDAPSRLTGIFAFESLRICREVSERFKWDLNSVQRFKAKDVFRATRVNMEVVSLARVAYRRAMLDAETINSLWHAYWEGANHFTLELPSVDARSRETCSVGVIWEWIVDGVLVRENGTGV